MTTDLQAQPATARKHAAPVVLPGGVRLPEWPARVWGEHLSILLALIVWAVPVTWGGGGQNAGILASGLAACLPGLLVILPSAVKDGRVRGRTVLLAVLLPVAALAVCLTAPTGWLGGSDVAAYAYAPVLALLVYAYTSSPDRRLGVAVLICVAGVAEFLRAWVSWHQYATSQPMIGTFYWHNQFATFLLPAALIGLAFTLWRVPRVWGVGWVVAPLCVAGVILSTSRASMAALIAGWVLVAALAVRARTDRRRVLVRLAAISLLAAVVTVLLCVPPLSGQSHSPFSATDTRTENQSLSSNGGYRVMFWRESVAVFEHWPVTGAGFESLETAAAPLTPAEWRPIQWAHNGYLQAFSDGGVVLGLPLLLATGLAIWLSLRLLWFLARWGAGRPGRDSGPGVGPGSGVTPSAAEGWLAAAAPLALLALLAHSFIDFDWFYPALFAQAGILFGLVASLSRPGRPAVPRPRESVDPVGPEAAADGGAAPPQPDRRQSRVVSTVVAICLVVALFAAAIDVVRHRDVLAYGAAQRVLPPNSVVAMSAASNRMLADYKPAQMIISSSLGGTVPRNVVLAALDQTSRAGEAVPRLQMLRARAQGAVLAERDQAMATLGSLPSQLMGRPEYAWDLAKALEAAGQPDEARLVLQGALPALPAGDPAREVLQHELDGLNR